MPRPEFDIVVIGGGAGGLVVAAGGAALGAKVALIDKERLGGDCLWYGCVPSKTLIKSARIAFQMRHADRWAIPSIEPRPDLAQVMERVRAVIAQIEPNDSPERFRGLGVEVILGAGRFVSPQAYEVNGRTLTAHWFVIATGSRPAVPPIAGLSEVPFLTNETLFDLREPVPHLVILGAGPIGCEIAQAFCRLGSKVTAIDMAARILPREDADAAEVVHRQLQSEGVRFHLGARVAGVALGEPHGDRIRVTVRDADGGAGEVTGSHLLVATGRTPNLDGLGLDLAEVRLDQGRLRLDNGVRTTNRRIYAIGDAAGPYAYTHMAEHHASVVLRHAIFRMRWVKPNTVVPWCTFTDPELAHVGTSETDARTHGIDHRVYRFAFADIDRARAEGETGGFAKLVTEPGGKLIGASIVGAHAGELIAECVLAMQRGLNVKALTETIHIYPTLASINRRAADQRLREGLTPRTRRLIQVLFGLRGART
ncbi:MAG TPA: FAD-dependent oxidoreductase [Casimicrobiaceae bacterium]|nr:FAD-dependent oxidoreductase [Casimicrobiaceae bacterium]